MFWLNGLLIVLSSDLIILSEINDMDMRTSTCDMRMLCVRIIAVADRRRGRRRGPKSKREIVCIGWMTWKIGMLTWIEGNTQSKPKVPGAHWQLVYQLEIVCIGWMTWKIGMLTWIASRHTGVGAPLDVGLVNWLQVLDLSPRWKLYVLPDWIDNWNAELSSR